MWVVNTPGPHWILHSPTDKAEYSSLTLELLSSCRHLSLISCRPTHEAQTLDDVCNIISPKFRVQSSLQRAEEGWGHTEPFPDPSLSPLTPLTSTYTHTHTAHCLNPMAPRMLLPQEKLCGWQYLKSFPIILLQFLGHPHPISSLMAPPN